MVPLLSILCTSTCPFLMQPSVYLFLNDKYDDIYFLHKFFHDYLLVSESSPNFVTQHIQPIRIRHLLSSLDMPISPWYSAHCSDHGFNGSLYPLLVHSLYPLGSAELSCSLYLNHLFPLAQVSHFPLFPW